MRLALVFLVAFAACSTEQHTMGLFDDPPTREETFTDATPFNPNSLNAMQDKIIALDLNKRPELQFKSVSPMHLLIKATNWAFTGDIGDAPANGLEAGLESSGAGDADFCISDVMYDGQVLGNPAGVGFRLWVSGAGIGSDITAEIWNHDFGGGGVTLIATATVNDVATFGIGGLTFLDITNFEVTAKQLTGRIYLRVTSNGAGAHVYLLLPIFEPPF